MAHIKIGHAVGSEQPDDKNGKKGTAVAGDQKAGNNDFNGEVKLSHWYLRQDGIDWRVLRHPDPEVRDKIAKHVEEACCNNNIGYNQSQRNTLHNKLIANGYNFKTVGKCECDCSSLVTAAAIAAGVKALEYPASGNAPRTATMETEFVKAGFKILTDEKYTRQDKHLLHGDIIFVAHKHTYTILEDGAMAEEEIKVWGKLNKDVNARKPKPETTAPKAAYFKKYTGKSGSIVDALRSIGAESTFAYRKTIAAKNKISPYSGTAAQNLKMLSLLKGGKLIKP